MRDRLAGFGCDSADPASMQERLSVVDSLLSIQCDQIVLIQVARVGARVFGVPAHLGEAPTWVSENLRDPGYHTALGLLYYGVQAHSEKMAGQRRRSGFLTGMKRLFANA